MINKELGGVHSCAIQDADFVFLLSVRIIQKTTSLITLPSQKDLVETILLENLEDNPRPKVLKHQVQPVDIRSSAAGTIFIDGREEVPKVYLEDVDQRWF